MARPAPTAFVVLNQDSKGGPYELGRPATTRKVARTLLLSEAGFICQGGDWLADQVRFTDAVFGHDLIRLTHRSDADRWIEFRVVPS